MVKFYNINRKGFASGFVWLTAFMLTGLGASAVETVANPQDCTVPFRSVEVSGNTLTVTYELPACEAKGVYVITLSADGVILDTKKIIK